MTKLKLPHFLARMASKDRKIVHIPGTYTVEIQANFEQAFIDNLRQWCQDRELNFEYQGTNRLRFTNEQDVTFFLMHWQGQERP